MKLSIVIIFFLYYNKIQAQQQQIDNNSSSATTTTSINATTTTSYNDAAAARPTPTPTSTESLITANTSNTNSSTSTTLSVNSTMTGSLPPFFSPSPTSFVFTHFPVLPFHTAALSSSSMMSSARPSQSAPFPDDTIGKYGRLHISEATRPVTSTLFMPIVLLLLSIFFMVFS